jgi:DNA-binding NtrC family response regulator
MLKRWDVLVACADLGNRNVLIRLLEGMSVGVYSCCMISQAAEVLSSRKIELVFCDETFSDGSFRDLLRKNKLWIGAPHFVVIVHFAECKECVDALQVDDFEVISTPLQPTDIELAVLRAMRNGGPDSFFQVSA